MSVKYNWNKSKSEKKVANKKLKKELKNKSPHDMCVDLGIPGFSTAICECGVVVRLIPGGYYHEEPKCDLVQLNGKT